MILFFLSEINQSQKYKYCMIPFTGLPVLVRFLEIEKNSLKSFTKKNKVLWVDRSAS